MIVVVITPQLEYHISGRHIYKKKKFSFEKPTEHSELHFSFLTFSSDKSQPASVQAWILQLKTFLEKLHTHKKGSAKSFQNK